MRRRAGKIALGLVAGLLVVLVGGYFYERPMLLTGTGYAAHSACAVTLIAHRDHPSDDLPPNPLIPFLHTSATADSARTSLFGLLAGQKAWYTPGFGCTLAKSLPALGSASPVSHGNPISDAPAPPAPSAAVAAALDKGFGTDLSAKGRHDLGTRAIVVLENGHLVAERYAAGFTASTPQLGWSMTKSVTDLLAGRLVAQGQLSLDQDHLRPEWTDGRARITVRQLLQMTSGLSWDETYSLGTPITTMLYREPDMGRYAAGRPLAHPPGTYLQYSSGSTDVLCSVLAPSHGGADFPRRELFVPLGLRSAVLEPDAAGTPVCSSYLWATPRDWAAIGQFALDDGVWAGSHLLPAGWMSAATRAVVVAKSEEKGYASGWWANRQANGSLVEPRLPADAYFAEGHDGQWLIVVPSQHLVVVRLGFTPVVKDDRATAVAADLIAALH